MQWTSEAHKQPSDQINWEKQKPTTADKKNRGPKLTWKAEASRRDLNGWAGCSTSPRWSTNAHTSRALAMIEDTEQANQRGGGDAQGWGATERWGRLSNRLSGQESVWGEDDGEWGSQKQQARFPISNSNVQSGPARQRHKANRKGPVSILHPTHTKFVCQQQKKHTCDV